MEKQMNQRGYASISTPDGKWRIWLHLPTASGRVTINCGFSLKKEISFVDAIDQLKYVQVDEVRQIDDDLSVLLLSCTIADYGEVSLKLLKDLPGLMERYLVNETIKSE